jgi:hypothetical protein
MYTQFHVDTKATESCATTLPTTPSIASAPGCRSRCPGSRARRCSVARLRACSSPKRRSLRAAARQPVGPPRQRGRPPATR